MRTFILLPILRRTVGALAISLMVTTAGWTQIEPIPSPMPDPASNNEESIVVSSNEDILLLDSNELEPTPADPKDAPTEAARSPNAASKTSVKNGPTSVRAAQATEPVESSPPIAPIPKASIATPSPSNGFEAPLLLVPTPEAQPPMMGNPSHQGATSSGPTTSIPGPAFYPPQPASPPNVVYEPAPAAQRGQRLASEGRYPQQRQQQVRVYQQLDAYGRPQRIVVVQETSPSRTAPANYYRTTPSAYAPSQYSRAGYTSTTTYRPATPSSAMARPAGYLVSPGPVPGTAVIAIPVVVQPAPYVPGRPVMNAIRAFRN